MSLFPNDAGQAVRRTRRPRGRESVPAGFFGSARQQPVRRVRRRRSQQPIPPIAAPSITGQLRGVPTDDMRRRLADMRRRLTQGL
jgi:hypothetical protein